MAKISTEAKKLAESLEIDLNKVEGTGEDGFITKADVQTYINKAEKADEYAKSNIMGALQANRARQESAKAEQGQEAIAEDLEAVIRRLQDRIDSLEGRQSEIEEARDPSESNFVLWHERGETVEHRMVINKRTQLIEQVRSRFYGQFKTEEDAKVYADTKARKREELDGIDGKWHSMPIITVAEARKIQKREQEEFDRQYAHADAKNTNVLDRQIFRDQGWGVGSGGEAKVVGGGL